MTSVSPAKALTGEQTVEIPIAKACTHADSDEFLCIF
jgi:hypothetical protein